jgi:hypothetical protein
MMDMTIEVITDLIVRRRTEDIAVQFASLRTREALEEAVRLGVRAGMSHDEVSEASGLTTGQVRLIARNPRNLDSIEAVSGVS